MKKMFIIVILFIGVFILCNKVYAYNEYSIGSKVTYNGVEYYVIENSDATSDTVKLFKAEPLSVEEVNQYGEGHINRYTFSSIGTAYDDNSAGYGGMAYYTSVNCGYVNGSSVNTGCITEYSKSDIKYVVDAWALDKVGSYDEARLITLDELKNNLGYNHATFDASFYRINPEYTPEWVYNPTKYWTMNPREDSNHEVWNVSDYGNINASPVILYMWTVRPVVVMNKDVLENNDSKLIPDDDSSNVVEQNSKSDSVNVPNTMQKVSIVLIMVGIALMTVSLIIVFKNKDKVKK